MILALDTLSENSDSRAERERERRRFIFEEGLEVSVASQMPEITEEHYLFLSGFFGL